MKNKSFLTIGLLGMSVLTAFKMTDDIIGRLGFEQNEAQKYILSNFIGIESGNDQNTDNLLLIPYTKMLPGIISGDKGGAAKELCQYVKNYINSEEFITQYAKRKEDAIPLEDNGTHISTLRGNVEVIQKNINNYKSDTKYVAEQEKELAEAQERLNNLLEAAKKPFPQKNEWEQAYPTNPSVLVKKRLEEYLKTAATVDFAAKITEPDNYRIKKFVNPIYENKSAKWKAIYRAGKEVNDVVTAFVKEWLKGEIISPEKVKMNTEDTDKKASNTKSNNRQENNDTQSSNTPTNVKPGEAEVPPVKEKKNLFKKLKDKTKAVINY